MNITNTSGYMTRCANANVTDADGGLYEDGLRALDAYRGVIDDLHREVTVRWGAESE